MVTSQILEAAEDGTSSTTDTVSGVSPLPSNAMTIARLLLLVKENQLTTAVILFAAWQAGIFFEIWYTIQGVCQV